jgi:hypothetical protein
MADGSQNPPNVFINCQITVADVVEVSGITSGYL